MTESGFTTNCQVLPDGELLVEAGKMPEHVFRLEAGQVSVYRSGELVCKLGPGSFLGADAAILGEPLRYSVRGAAAPASWLNQYELHDFTHAFTANPALAELVSASLDAFAAALERHQQDLETDPTRRIAIVRHQTKSKAQRVHALLE